MYQVFSILCCLWVATPIHAAYLWTTLPPTPQLPQPSTGQYVNVNHANLWFNSYGRQSGIPILFLHGGLANSDYWGLQVDALKASYRCIVVDSRGQGRSTLSTDPVTYDLMMSDIIKFLDLLEVAKVHVVGWNDGATIGLNLAMNHPERVISVYAFAANYRASGLKDMAESPVFADFFNRSQAEYAKLNPVNDYVSLYNNLTTMWVSLPNWDDTDFAKIPSNVYVWIAAGDHEDTIIRDQVNQMASWIPHSGQLILPRTNQFAFLQDPDMFTASLKQFLSLATTYMSQPDSEN